MADETTRGNLAVVADIELDVADERVQVWSDEAGDLVVLSAPSLRAARRLLAAPSALPVAIETLDAGLRTAGVTVEVRVRHAPVARLGPGAEPNRISRVLAPRLGLPRGTAVRPRGLAVALFRRVL